MTHPQIFFTPNNLVPKYVSTQSFPEPKLFSDSRGFVQSINLVEKQKSGLTIFVAQNSHYT